MLSTAIIGSSFKRFPTPHFQSKFTLPYCWEGLKSNVRVKSFSSSHSFEVILQTCSLTFSSHGVV